MMATRPISLPHFEKAPHILVRNALQILLVLAMIAATLIVLPARAEAETQLSFQVSVSVGSDDAEENAADGSIGDLGSTDLELVHDGQDQVVGLRFQGVAIPAGATIVDAYIEFEVDEDDAEATSLTISGEADADPVTFTADDHNVSGRSRTTAVAAWSPGEWSPGDVGTKKQTSDISAVVQEIVDLGGWVSGNAMAFIIEGSGKRVAVSYDKTSGDAPLLVVEYTVSDPTIFVSGTPLVPFGSEPGVASDEQSYMVSGVNLAEGVVVTAPTNFEVSLSSGGPFGALVSLPESGGSVASTEVFVRMNAASEGAPSGDITHASTGAASVDVAVSGSVVAIPDVWVAYNDMNTSVGGSNPANVTSYDYAAGGALTDYDSGVVLPVTVTGSTNRPDGPEVHGSGGPVSNASSDAYAVFDGIVDLAGTDEIDDPTWDSTLTFEGLDPAELYAVTLSANRDNPDYDGNRWARVTIDGVDASTAASSAGVVVNSPTSISFSVGNNADNGYVARWIDINPGADGSFTVSSEWDDTQGDQPPGPDNGHENTKGYAMSAFRLETYDVVDVTDPVVVLSTPADGATYYQGEVVTVDYACGDFESGIASCDGDASGVPVLDGSTLDTSTLGSGFEFTVTAVNGAGLTTAVTHSYDVVEAPTLVEEQVGAPSDDAEEAVSDGVMDLTSSDLEFIRSDQPAVGDQLVGMRFSSVPIPAGATIVSAFLEFAADETSSEATTVEIAGEDADNPGTFTSAVGDISSRTQTAAEVLWSPGAWDAVGGTHQSPDISRVVQEIVDRDGWASGNAMAFIVEGDGKRVAESFDGDGEAPVLLVEYVTSPVPSVASFQQDPGGYSGTVDTFLEANEVDADNSAATTLIVDYSPPNQVLLRFEDVLGSGPGQVPEGSVIQSAELEINVTDESIVGASLYRMLQPWNDVDNWDTWTDGIQTDGTEAEMVAESSSPGSAAGKASSIDVTADLQAWSDDPDGNHGWAWLQDQNASWQFDSAEGGTPPILTIKYFPPDVAPPEQNVNVFVDQWSVQANQWPIGENVSLTIQHRNAADDGWDDAYYDETFPSVDAPWDPGMGQFVAQFDIGEAIVAGDLVTASGDVSGSPVVKEHVVTGLAFTGVNVDTDTVSGTAEPGFDGVGECPRVDGS